MPNLKYLLRYLGPGLLFASMAIGTSHLVLSTKAGAQYGWLMAIPIVLANVLKYPFFEFGVRYTNLTDKTLIEGYAEKGRWYLWFYALINLVSSLTMLAALYTVTAGLLINLLGVSYSMATVALVLFVLISALLIIGRYKFLENALKWVVSLLFLALLVTTVAVVVKGSISPSPDFNPQPFFDGAGILFIIGLVGWMPTAVEASTWMSFWGLEKQKLLPRKPSLSEALTEFGFGYALTALLALFFLLIGWLTLYGSGTEISGNGIAFADQLVSLFTTHIGAWSYPIIAIAAFATMFSTCMTAHDALARVNTDVVSLLAPKLKWRSSKGFTVMVLLLALVNFLVILGFGANMGILVGIATFVSFVMAPLLGYMNLKVVNQDHIPATARPGTWLHILSYIGIVVLTLFAAYYGYIILF
ncbi:NRAMP family divalent metal transporter [Sediminicola luteus]|uniref:NRAMP family protein n=1 Tax=Sediminicola luteus TaxID=319238 RepID=A0A2A4G5K3_9FLAO|nr:divalent metal cation transporter [Sediminicola luteus]PCE63270.1 NRAMP family protein [Sediminicola luteus]